jgi:predicted alpha/beta-fold hydrolase
MPLISSDFYSSWWLVCGHLQTLLPSFLRFVSVSGRPVGIDLPDGDRLSTEL